MMAHHLLNHLFQPDKSCPHDKLGWSIIAERTIIGDKDQSFRITVLTNGIEPSYYLVRNQVDDSLMVLYPSQLKRLCWFGRVNNRAEPSNATFLPEIGQLGQQSGFRL